MRESSSWKTSAYYILTNRVRKVKLFIAVDKFLTYTLLLTEYSTLILYLFIYY